MYNRDELLRAAENAYPKEACGFLVNGVLVPITNISEDPTNGFVMCPKEVAEVLDRCEPEAVYHTHPDETATPSDHDLARINRADTPLPWLIASWPEAEVTLTLPRGQSPLIGRKFTHGVEDCYTLIRDFYKLKLGINLYNYQRQDEWWEKGQNLYLENYKGEGFYEVPLEEIQYGDMLLMQVMSDTTNHAATYLGDGSILHHLYGRLSRVDVYGGYMAERTTRTLRHKDYSKEKVQPLRETDYANYN